MTNSVKADAWPRASSRATVSEVAIFVDSPREDHSLEISNLRAREVGDEMYQRRKGP